MDLEAALREAQRPDGILMPSILSTLLALAVVLPIVVLLGLAAHYFDEDEGSVDARPRRSHPKRNTWPPDEVEA